MLSISSMVQLAEYSLKNLLPSLNAPWRIGEFAFRNLVFVVQQSPINFVNVREDSRFGLFTVDEPMVGPVHRRVVTRHDCVRYRCRVSIAADQQEFPICVHLLLNKKVHPIVMRSDPRVLGAFQKINNQKPGGPVQDPSRSSSVFSRS